MRKSNLLNEAIADANAVREMALQNAEEVLKETFHNRLQSLVSKSLQMEEEEEEEDDDAEFEERLQASFAEKAREDDEEFSDEEEAEESYSAAEGEESEEEEEEMTDEDIELEAIIRELEQQIEEAEKEESGEEEEGEEEELEEASDSSKIGSGDNKMPDGKASTSAASEDPEKLQKGNQNKNAETPKKMDESEEVNLDELLEEFFGESKDEDEDEKEAEKKVDEIRADLEEAYATIHAMRKSLNEVNLLNSKLLYSNKVFRSYDLNEDQKLKVIENFDRASNIRETKLIYATLVESFSTPVKRKGISEGYASKAVGSTKPSKEVIKESNDLVRRFQRLAKIK
jgi:hypothetical protein